MTTWMDKLRGPSVQQDGVALPGVGRVTTINFLNSTLSYNDVTGVLDVQAGGGDLGSVSVGSGLNLGGGILDRAALTGDVSAALGSNVTAIGANKVTLAMMATVATAMFLGRASALTGNVEALTATQATAMLNVGTESLKGLVAPPGTATGKFYRDDHTWAYVTGSFVAPANPADDGKLSYAAAGANAWAATVKTNGTYLSTGADPATSGTLRLTAADSLWYKHASLGNLRVFDVSTNISIGDVANATGTDIFYDVGVTKGHYFRVGVVGVGLVTTAGFRLTPQVSTGTVVPALSVTDAAHTALTASTERNSVLFDLTSNKQWATGDITTQRAMRIRSPTYSFVGASVITTAATVTIGNAPTAGTNATITNSYALLIEAGSLGFSTTTTSRGLINVPAGGFGGAGGLIVGGRTADGSAEVDVLRYDSANKVLLGGSTGVLAAILSVATGGGGEFRVNSSVKYAWDAGRFDFKAGYLRMESQAAPSSPSSTDISVYNEGGYFKIKNALQTFVFDAPTITRGTDLTDANQTKNISDGSRLVIPVGSRTASRNTTIGTSGGPVARQTMWIECQDTTANTKVILNGGTSGGTIYTIPGSTKQLVAIQFDGTDWSLSSVAGVT